MKLKELHRIEMPRERLQKYGAGKLADYELLAILLGSGVQGVNVLALAKQILKKVRAVGAGNINLEELQKIRGLGTAKASQVVALLALAGRLNTNEPASVFQTKDIYQLCADFRASKKEHFAAFYLDTQNNLIERHIISIGTLNSSLVHPREVFEPAIRHSAANIIVAPQSPRRRARSVPRRHRRHPPTKKCRRNPRHSSYRSCHCNRHKISEHYEIYVTSSKVDEIVLVGRILATEPYLTYGDEPKI